MSEQKKLDSMASASTQDEKNNLTQINMGARYLVTRKMKAQDECHEKMTVDEIIEMENKECLEVLYGECVPYYDVDHKYSSKEQQEKEEDQKAFDAYKELPFTI